MQNRMRLRFVLTAAVVTAVIATVGLASDDMTSKPAAPARAAAAAPAEAQAPPVVDLERDPTLYVVGYAHLDTQWRWTYATTIREYIANTLHDNFKLMDKYPHYIFNFGGSRRYQMMQEYYPADYEKLKGYVAAGKWFPCGSSVDENDANVPSAESFVRHILYGNKFFRSEFNGVTSDEYMLPDCFGFPYALPSMLAHCGIIGFSTQKLTWGSPIGIPFKVGVWEGPDGRSVIAALDPGAYVGEVRDDLSANDSWITRVNNNGTASGVFTDYHYYGTGDQGGAPTEKSVQMIEKSINGGGPLNVISSASDWMFKSITPEMAKKLPRYKGELLLTQHSAGSLSSQATMKRWNRKNELLADAAERASVAAWWMGAAYPSQRLENAWYLVLGSQMHDILPGTSHPKAYEYSWNDEALAANQFCAMLTDGVGAVSSVLDTQAKGTALVVFNPLSIEREDVIEARLPWKGSAPASLNVIGPDDKPALAQVLGLQDGVLRIAFLAKVPSMGFVVFDVQKSDQAAESTTLHVTERLLENDRYRVTLNEDGDIASIFDKTNKREVLASPSRLALQYEKPANWPAWNMDWDDRKLPPRSYVGGPAKFRVTEGGPARIAVEVTREHEGSTYVQTIRLSAGEAGDRIDVDNAIDWTTRERSLKATFPLTVSNPKATYDLQTGAIERTNNDEKHYENPSHLWFDLTDSQGDYGVTITNDSRFGSDKPDDNTVRLTMLYTPGARGDYQDQATQDIGRHQVLYAIAPHAGDWRSANTPLIAARLNQPLRAFIAPSHSGVLGKSFSLASVSNPHVMITAVKKAEESGQVIVRVRELSGADATNVRITMPSAIVEAIAVDGQERPIGEATLEKGALVTDVHGYGLRAFALKLGDQPAKIVPPTSMALDLPYDLDVVSSNGKRNDGSVDADGRSFPAEQLAAPVICNGVTFKLGSTADGKNNALRARGQSIALPSGDFDRIELIVASAGSDQPSVSNEGFAAIPSWRGYIGQWDNRVWKGEVPEVAYTWTPTFDGLIPGYIKQAEVAWFCSHHHTPAGDQAYEYCYLFKVGTDLKEGEKTFTFPNNEAVIVMAASAVKDAHQEVVPAAPLFDTLDDRTQDAPRISPAGGTFADVTEVRIEPRLFGRSEAIRYTLDGSDPAINSAKYTGPILLNQSAKIKAAMLASDGELGPVTSEQISVNDRTPPRVLSATPMYREPVIALTFSEPLETASATAAKNYMVDEGVKVNSVALDESSRRVTLTLDSPLESGKNYTLRIHSVADCSPAHNTVSADKISVAVPSPVYSLSEVTVDHRGKPIAVANLPVKGGDSWTLNMFVRAEQQPPNRTVIAGFGACDGRVAGGGRYICKFGDGLRFWAHNADLEGHALLDLGRWQMLTVTSDGTTLRFYKDGQLLSEGGAGLSDDQSVVNIAPMDPWDHRRQFEGEVRDLTIWNIAMNQEALQSLQRSMQRQ
jgi:alpha-mannosidase